MKTKLVSAGFMLLIAALATAGYAPAQNNGSRGATGSDSTRLITVLNPAVANKMAPRLPLAPRLDSLDGKTLYMADINWGGPEAAYSVFEQMQSWFKEHMPSVKVVIRRKKGSYMVPDESTWKEVKDGGGDAAIVGISG